jgi:alpha-aminoadipic semialdehyde synthase
MQKNLRLFAIGDVSADFEGSIEFLRKFTTIDKPFFQYDPKNDKIHDDPQAEVD